MVTPVRGLLSYLVIVTYLATSSIAQVLTSVPSAPTTTSLAAVQTHTIDVGNGDHKFRPEVTQAEIGDVRTSLPFLRMPDTNKAEDHRIPFLPSEPFCRARGV